MAPRGPRSALCVVNVTTSACGHRADGNAPPATSPMKCDASTQKQRSDLVARSRRNAAKSIVPRVRGVAGEDHARTLRERSGHGSDPCRAAPVSWIDLVPDEVEPHPETLTGEPCVRCPPCASSMPNTGRAGSRGSRNAPNTAMFAVAPAWGCTLACSGAEQLLRAIDRELFDDVDVLGNHRSTGVPDTLPRTCR